MLAQNIVLVNAKIKKKSSQSINGEKKSILG